HAPAELRVAAVGGTVESTLYDAIRRAGEGASLVAAFVDPFAWDIDFQVDPQPGDHFRVLVEKQPPPGDHTGRPDRVGRVLAAEYAGRTGTFRAFRFPSEDGGDDAFYDERGEPLRKSLLRTPLKYARF